MVNFIKIGLSFAQKRFLAIFNPPKDTRWKEALLSHREEVDSFTIVYADGTLSKDIMPKQAVGVVLKNCGRLYLDLGVANWMPWDKVNDFAANFQNEFVERGEARVLSPREFKWIDDEVTHLNGDQRCIVSNTIKFLGFAKWIFSNYWTNKGENETLAWRYDFSNHKAEVSDKTLEHCVRLFIVL